MSGDSRRSRWTWAAATVGLAMAAASVASGTLVSTNGSSVKPSSGWTASATNGQCDKHDCGDGNHNQVRL